jgi:sulfite exporter TauE/SafE
MTFREMRRRTAAGLLAAAAAALALGCAISGDGPLRFVVRLFTLDYLPALETGASLVTVALFGFLTSFHCIGMCGGIIISQCAGHERGGIRQGLAYNIGRVIACTLIGFAAGALGSLIGLNGYLKGLVPLVCALVMLVMGLNLLGLFRWLGVGGEAEPGFVKRLAGRGAFIVGFVTGFLPCGMLQIVQLHALGSGSALKGAAIMFVFGAPTSPVLFAFGTLAGSLAPKRRDIAMKAAAVIVILMAVKMLMKALTLMGLIAK